MAKNVLKFMIMSLLVTVLFVGCELIVPEEDAGDEGPDPTVITITNYPGKNERYDDLTYLFNIFENKPGTSEAYVYAFGLGGISKNSFAVSLAKDGKDWQGTGDFYLQLNIYSGAGGTVKDVYIYTNGGTNIDAPVKFPIKNLQETISFSKFKLVP